MSEEKEKNAPAPAAPPAKGGGASMIGMILPALIAGAAAFGGAKFAGGHHGTAAAATEAPPATKPPGPTLSLDPFLLAIPDGNKKTHPMKVTLAVEFDGGAEKEEGLKPLIPRFRDSVLGYLRSITYEDALDASASDKMRNELLERLRACGAPKAEHVLITDLVVQ
jgi:flagellar basal body-associated protein FliL